MAGTFSLAFKGLGKSWEAIRGAGKEAPPIHPDTDVVINGQLLSADQKVISFRADGSPATASESGAKLQVSLARDADGRMLMLDHSEAGTWVKRAGSDKFERIPLGEPVPVKPGDEVRLGSDTGPKLEMGTAKRPEGSLGRAGSDAATAKPGLPDNWPKNIADVNGEPPVPPGHIRLYRGVKPSESEFLKPLTEQEWARWDDLLEKRAQGGKYTPFEQAEYEDLYKRFRQGHKSYSDSKATALHYAGEDGKLLYVDVPAGEALAMRDGGTGYLIGGGDLARVPHEYHVKAREHFDSPTNPRQTAPKAGAPPGRAGSEAPAREAPTTGTARGAEAGTGNARVNARNTDGNVTSVTDARGSQTSFEYSADGSVNKITHSDGTVLTTTDGKNWKIKSGNEELSLTAEFHVGDDGTLWQKTPKGEIVGSHADGSRVVREVDGTARLYGADNKLNELVTPGGERTKIEYGMDGDIHQLRHHDGTIVRSEDGFNWKITEPEGQTYDWRGKIEIDGQGHLKRTMASADPDLGPPGRRSGTSEADHGFGRP
jgi:YD repeat-containing protein